MKIKYYCEDCGEELKGTHAFEHKRCRECHYKWIKIPENNPNHKDGRSLRNNSCPDCGTEISWNAKRCRPCASKNALRKHNHLSELRKGRKFPGTGISRPGKLNFNWKGGIKTEKHYCMELGCNNEISYSSWKQGQGRCHACAMKKRWFNPKFKKSMSKLKQNNKFGYIHGRGYEPYTSEWTKELKEIIRKRDKYICQNCSMTEEEHIIVLGINLTIHHIDYDKKNCKEENLITLCNQCNLRANKNREHWKEYFKQCLFQS